MKPWRSGAFCGEALRYWRQQARLRQKDVAAALGMNKNTIKYYEAGATPPTSESIVVLVKLLGCNLGDLFSPPPEAPSKRRVKSAVKLPPRPPRCSLPGLPAIRERRGMSQMEAGVFLGVSAGSIKRWEAGEKTSWANVERFARLLEVHPAALVVPPKMAPKYHPPWSFRGSAVRLGLDRIGDGDTPTKSREEQK